MDGRLVGFHDRGNTISLPVVVAALLSTPLSLLTGIHLLDFVFGAYFFFAVYYEFNTRRCVSCPWLVRLFFSFYFPRQGPRGRRPHPVLRAHGGGDYVVQAEAEKNDHPRRYVRINTCVGGCECDARVGSAGTGRLLAVEGLRYRGRPACPCPCPCPCPAPAPSAS